MFDRAAETRDLFLGNEKVGDFLPTMQKYYMGISVRRYVMMVCIEYPLICAFNFLTWMAVPASLCYMLWDTVSGIWTDRYHAFTGTFALIGFLIASALAVGVFFFAWGLIRTWAASGPSFPVRVFLIHRYSGKDPDFDDFPEKFPGPIALLKKWLLSTGSGESSKITWDSGKKREGW